MRQLKITQAITNRDSKSIKQYLEELSSLSEAPLTAEEEADLSRRIREENCDECKEKLIKSNLRFVISVAKQYQNQGMHLSDIINEGNLGLIKASERFDETRGFKFISYAVWWIRQSILQALAENAKTIRLPLNKVGIYNKVIRAHRELEFELERTPTNQEIADRLQFKVKEVNEVIISQSGIMSLDADLIKGEEGTSLIDVLYNKDDLTTDHLLKEEDSKTRINLMLKSLSERERLILESYYGLNGREENTLQFISDGLGLTRERTRQIKEKALKKLRHRILKGHNWISKK